MKMLTQIFLTNVHNGGGGGGGGGLKHNYDYFMCIF